MELNEDYVKFVREKYKDRIDEALEVAITRCKPMQGLIHNWVLNPWYHCDVIEGECFNHPHFGSQSYLHTSEIMKISDDLHWCETRNSIYALGAELPVKIPVVDHQDEKMVMFPTEDNRKTLAGSQPKILMVKDDA